MEEPALCRDGDERGELAGRGPEEISPHGEDDERRRDSGQGRRQRGRELGHVTRGPGGERDQPGLKRGLVVVRRAVQLRKEPRAPREHVLGEHGEARLVVCRQDAPPQVDGGHQDGRRRHPQRGTPGPRMSQVAAMGLKIPELC